MNEIAQIGIGCLAVGVLVVVSLFLLSHVKEQRKKAAAQAVIDERVVTELCAERDRLISERNTATALFELAMPERNIRDGALPNYTATVEKINKLIASFDSLSTYQEVNVWDTEAKTAAEASIVLERALNDRHAEFTAIIDAYKATNTDPPNLAEARIEKSLLLLKKLSGIIASMPQAYDHLMARAERTPGSKKEQALLLRELRTEKKELQAEKKAIKTGASQIRREARQQASEAGIVDGVFGQYYASRVATWERRAIRRAKEAALGPHEDAMTAVDRQINAVEEKITWLQRFGEGVVDPDDID